MLALYDRLRQFDAPTWTRAVDTLLADIHPIDRNATRIWFAFYPLDLHLAIEASPDPAATARTLGLMGRWRLADQVDGSHRFLYGHRYWPQVKAAIQNADGVAAGSLAAIVTAVAETATRTSRVDREQLLGITAVGLMTLRQVGTDVFSRPGQFAITPEARRLSPHQLMSHRAKDDWQGLFGFLRGLRKRWTVTFDENEPAAHFPVIDGQEIATAARDDHREYRSADVRCTPNEGPIPVECRAGSCGTCWIGVLAGAEKLSPVVERDEGRRMRVFGYADSTESRPLLRLACQARAHGAVSIVIPPWNGVFGKIRPND